MSFVFDVSKLSSLRKDVREGDAGAQRKVAQQFEAMMLQMMMKSMREATPPDGFLETDQTRMLKSIYDAQMAERLSEQGGMGLAEVLLGHLERYQATRQQVSEALAEMTDVPLKVLRPGWNSDGSKDAYPSPGTLQGVVTKLREAVSEGMVGMVGMFSPTSLGGMQAASVSSSGSAPGHVMDFVSRLLQPAQAVAQASGLPLKLILGQAALESGWGQREIRGANGEPTHNLFGIKATGNWAGKVVEVLTTEFVDGKAVKMIQPFRAYASYEQALRDYAQLITSSERYREVVNAGDPYEAARRIQAAGYATDPSYADKLIRVMRMLPVIS